MASFSEPDTELITIGFSGWHGHPAIMEGPHRHNEVELNFVEEGSISYLSGGARVTIRSGQLAVFWAAVPHRLVRTEEPTTSHWLTLPLTWFLQWRLPEALVRAILHGEVHLSREPELSLYDRVLFAQWRHDLEDGSEERRQVLLLELEARLRRLALSASGALSRKESSEGAKLVSDEAGLGKVEQMMRFIAEHYTEPLRVAEVAGAVGLHPNYALTLFRRVLGMGIVDYMAQHRVSHAQRLLATTDAGGLEIALAAGFGSPSRFYAVFKRECRCSPKEYRRSMRTR